MVDLFRDHRSDDTNFISHFLVIGKIVTDQLTRLSILGEFRQVTLTFQFLSLQLGDGLSLGIGVWHRLTIEFIQFRLVIKCFKMGWTTRHAKKDDTFGFWQVMWYVNSGARVDSVGCL